jgi:hypothetical protein
MEVVSYDKKWTEVHGFTKALSHKRYDGHRIIELT